MPLQKSWKRAAAARRSLEGYHLPKTGTEEQNLVKKDEGEDLIKITKDDGYRITKSGTEENNLLKPCSKMDNNDNNNDSQIEFAAHDVKYDIADSELQTELPVDTLCNVKKANTVAVTKEPLCITKGKLKPGKMPYIKPKKHKGSEMENTCTVDKINIVSMDKPVCDFKTESERNSKLEVPEVTKHKTEDFVSASECCEQLFIPNRPHNIANFKAKFMPRTKPFSKPRTKISLAPACKTSCKPVKCQATAPTSVDNDAMSVNKSCVTNRFIHGSFHQGDPQFGENSGRQCVANCFIAMVFNNIKKVSNWEGNDLDFVLTNGNELYMYIQRSSTTSERYLLVSELPENAIEILGKTFNVNRGESFVGLINRNVENTPHTMNIDQALQTVFSEHDACFVTFAGATFAVIQSDEKYWIFDSHSRSSSGLQIPNGTSIVIEYSSLHQVYKHCMNLALSMSTNADTQFEVTGMTVQKNEPCVVAMETDTSIQADNIDSESDDGIEVEHIEHNQFIYHPFTAEICDLLCKKTSMKCEHQRKYDCEDNIKMGKPCTTQLIKGDGNCFFRCLSFAISGTEMNHRKMRLAVVKHLRDHAELFHAMLSPNCESIEHYITESRMWYVGTWATELEILAAASLLNVDIYTFSNAKWLRHSCIQTNQHTDVHKPSIYLNHVNQSHYDVVTCVKRADYENMCANQCYNSCTNMTKKRGSCWLSMNPSEEPMTKRLKLNKRKGYFAHCQQNRENMKTKRAADKNDTFNEHSDAKYEKLAKERKRYHTDQDFRERKKRQFITKYKFETKICESKKAKSVEKYAQNKQFREYVKACSKEKYVHDEEFRQSVKAYSKEKYVHNEEFRQSVKTYSKEKYVHNEEFRQFVNTYNTEKYANDQEYRETLKKHSVYKYKNDEEFRETVKKHSVAKYADDDEFRETVKRSSITKYAESTQFKEKVNVHNLKKYAENPEYRENMKAKNRLRATETLNARKKMEKVEKDFQNITSNGPECICSVCHRRLFRKQVIKCQKDVYENKSDDHATNSRRCITETYFHVCTNCCEDECTIARSPRGTLWICHTCHRKLLSCKMPAEAVANNLALKSIPDELQCLNDLEQHLISLNIPFMKLMALPKGGQHGVHGPVVCIPSSIQKVTSVLPRCDSEDQMIRVKLKRKLTYKGHYQYKFVSKAHVQNALSYLKRNNKWYSDIEFNDDWINPLPVIDEENESNESDSEALDDLANANGEIENEEQENENGLLLDTCLQPADIGQEVLDQHFEKISCVAPAEGNHPIRLLMDKCHEAMSFPVLFPSGTPTFHDEREERITLARYLHTRLMNADSRFARNTDYIFYAQYLSELNQVVSNVSIALRKGLSQQYDRNITFEDLTDNESLQKILKCDEGYKFLTPIRGTPPFWQSVQKDLFAMLRQLGIPTWFCSFSSADLRWPEIIETILRESGDTRKISELDWSEKCSILRRNPVTAARMFDQRFHCFLKDVIMSPAEPIGKIKDYFYRVEFQQRGSPHTHCLFWVENAPKIDKDKDSEVETFIDKYVTCEMPSVESDENLFDIVNSVQKHSKRHSKSCKKNGITCRFNFPRPPSSNTFISRPGSSDLENTENETVEKQLASLKNVNVMTQQQAKSLLKRIWDAIGDEESTFQSVNHLFTAIGLTQELFEKACNTLSRTTNIVLKRQPSHVWINQYNANLLRCWNANMDIQYVVDAYACVVYIISYISKAEREMGLLLNHAQKEATKDGNNDAKQSLKKLGAVYLQNREISAQEAVFRVCNLRLKEASRKVQFIPTVNAIRLSLPISVLKQKQRSGELDEDDIWMTSIVDRYKNRPVGDEFDKLCLASFCSEYRVVYKSEISRVSDEKRHNPVVTLQNGFGYVQKRSRTEAAIVRYARFSPSLNAEKYYQSLLQLFLPHRSDSQLKPVNIYNSFQDFYENGCVEICNFAVEPVKIIVDRNKAMFEQNADEIEHAQELLEKCVPMEDAWAQICPETESERLECQQEKSQLSDSESENDSDKHVPDLLDKDKVPNRTELLQGVVSKEEADDIFRSLNDEQAEIFYKIRQWCLSTKNGQKPDPFHVFITGGAGTGKSHLIKAICYDATKHLAHCQENPDAISVLLVAPTGVAAFNIHASTIHSAFSIGINVKLPYQPLSDEKINTLRSKLHAVQILIIDEISMVDHKLLSYIHGRLRQIKQCVDHSPFGRVSVIAVGDFHQLSPAKGKSLCIEQNGYDLWNDNFTIAVLTKVMRQKNSVFAELLNRLRTRKKSEPLLACDLKMLKKREIENDDPNVLHIFATNAQVDEHNITSLHELCSDPICIEAKDFARSMKNGEMEEKPAKHSKVYNSVLQRHVNLAVGARIMLTKNVCTSDGLVNGAFGTVTGISFKDDKTFPSVINVAFDKKDVGQKLRNENHVKANSTPIVPQEDQISNNGGTRRQFPLKLAWATTIHKVQGLTVEKAVISLDKIFAPGQAYVALSRVPSLDGLIIKDFKESAIYCNTRVEEAVSVMPNYIIHDENDSDHQSACTIILQNIEGLASHIKDLNSDKRFHNADFICLTETWLLHMEPHPLLDGFTLHHKPRSLSYQSTDELMMKLQTQSHGGVAFYSNEKVNYEILHLPVSDLEFIAFTIIDMDITIVVVYRPQSYTANVFRKNLLHLIEEVNKHCGQTIIMGDFNENIHMSSSIETFMHSNGFKQIVSEPTTEGGTLIDHVYIKRVENVSVDILPTHFGYHEAIQIGLH